MPRFSYYCGLVHHRADFARGLPILVYHKVGPRPRGVRGRSLYIDPARFARQLRELRAAGFRDAGLDDAPGDGPRRVVITFDDGYENAFRNAAGPLAEAGFRAIQFLVPGLIGKRNEWDLPAYDAPERLMDAAQVRDWLAAGHGIGAHTMTHPHLCQLPPARAREEIVASKQALEDQFGVPVEHFAYPYGEWNEAVRDLVAGAGFRTASTTRAGVNRPTTPPLELLRYLACPPIRTPRQTFLRLLDRLAMASGVRRGPGSGLAEDGPAESGLCP